MTRNSQPEEHRMEETVLSGPDALRSHLQRKYGNRQVLFRGEHKDWGTTHSSLDRLQASKQIPERHWAEFDRRYLHVAVVLDVVVNARPVFAAEREARAYTGPGSLLDEHDRLTEACLVYATFQHHGVPSPFIDLTESLEIALFFCSYPDETTDTAVMFVVDPEHESIRGRLARMPDTKLYRTSRYARQAAHGLCLRLGSGTRDVDYATGEDFRHLQGVVEKISFPWSADLRAGLHERYKKSLLSAADDKLAWHVYQACHHGLDQHAFDCIRVDEIFRRVRDNLAVESHYQVELPFSFDAQTGLPEQSSS